MNTPAAYLPTRLAPLLIALSATALHSDDNWPHWRGSDATGASDQAEPVTSWAEDKNVVWKVETLGQGSGTPILWEGKIYYLAAINTCLLYTSDAADDASSV